MSMQDPIADMLTRVRNAQMTKKQEVSMPSSKVKAAIANVLKEEGYISGFEVTGDIKKTLTVNLKYYNGAPVIEKIQRVSKPGCRNFASSKDLPEVLNGLGIAIVSTSAGVMTASKAAANGHGGEVLCFVA